MIKRISASEELEVRLLANIKPVNHFKSLLKPNEASITGKNWSSLWTVSMKHIFCLYLEIYLPITKEDIIKQFVFCCYKFVHSSAVLITQVAIRESN